MYANLNCNHHCVANPLGCVGAILADDEVDGVSDVDDVVPVDDVLVADVVISGVAIETIITLM